MSRSWRGVRAGTPLHGKSLCESCSHSHIIKGDAASEQFTRCDAMYDAVVTVPFRRVVECSRYTSKTAQSLYEMQKIAFVLETDRRGKPIGFVPNKEWRKENPDIDPVVGSPLINKVDS